MNQSYTTTVERPATSPDFRAEAARRDGMSGAPVSAASEAASEVERSIAYMADHINQPLQVATLAAMANVSPSHFFVLFKQRTGSTPMDYFTRLRMRHAGRLLDSTSARVKEVAAALGYDDPFYFSRVFKSIHRVPPSRYRTARQWMNGAQPAVMAGGGSRE